MADPAPRPSCRFQTGSISDRGETSTDPLMLVLRIMDHDEIAFERVFRHFRKHVLFMAMKLLRSQCDAEEVLQDVFMALWHRPPALAHGLPSLVAWLTVTTRNQCWMRMRRAQPESPAGEARDPGHFEPVLEKLVGAELRSILEREFLRTPQKHRDVLKLTYFGGLGATAIASELNVPVITVRKRLEGAIAHLRRRLGSDKGPVRGKGAITSNKVQAVGHGSIGETAGQVKSSYRCPVALVRSAGSNDGGPEDICNRRAILFDRDSG
jgi:RNA polymerase sigma-70 factor (ECF subfamily)